MTIPTYKEITPEMLRLAAKIGPFKVSDLEEQLAKLFSLTEEEVSKGYDSADNKHRMFRSRMGWAKSSLYRSGLLEKVSRGVFKVSPKGVEVSSHDEPYIQTYIEENYIASSRKKSKQDAELYSDTSLGDSTPNDMMEKGYHQIKEELKNDILDKVMEMSPKFFEDLVVKLLKNMGYGDPVKGEWSVTQGSNDEGIDGIIKEDALGLEAIYLQAKRWANTVGRPEIQKFMGALAGKGAKKGVFITTSDYSSGAIEYAEKVDMRIILIDGSQLAEYMIDYNVGVSHENTYVIKSIDTDFFEE